MTTAGVTSTPDIAVGRPAVPAVPAGPGPVALTRPAAARRRRRAFHVPRLARRVLGPLAAIGLWQLVCSLGVFTSVEVASPVAVIDAARQLWAQGALQSNLLISLQRVAEGLILGVAAGVL